MQPTMQASIFTPAALMLAALLLCSSCSGASKVQEDSQPGTSQLPARSASEQSADPALLTAAQKARESFADGAPSLDALMDEFVRALSQNDTEALTRLRVSKAEYVDLIVPGTVPVGTPPRNVSQSPKEFFWTMLDTKSRYFADNLIKNFGGRTYTHHELKLSRPMQEYAWYKAHGEVRMELAGTDDVTYHVLTGWVAEVDGKYKFIGYEFND